MAEWLTIDEAAEFLRQRGVTVRRGNQERPPSRHTVFAWCKNGILKRTQQKGVGEKRRYWLIDREELETFTPPKLGRPQDANPSPLAQAQRESRRRRGASEGSQSVAVTGDRIGADVGDLVGDLVEHVKETPPAPPALELRGIPCPICEKRGLHHPNKPDSREKDTSLVYCRYCGRVAPASEIAPWVAAHHELHTTEATLKAAEEQAGHPDDTQQQHGAGRHADG